MRQIRDSEYGVVVDRGNGFRAYGAECQLKLLPDAAISGSAFEGLINYKNYFPACNVCTGYGSVVDSASGSSCAASVGAGCHGAGCGGTQASPAAATHLLVGLGFPSSAIHLPNPTSP